jgi:DNA-binding NtrC family response regulator
MEAELFGYEKGAFTGAVSAKPGRFELAHGGTLFLDEIGELPVEMQVKLLRVLQESEFERVGGLKTIKVDVRLVAATKHDLHKKAAAGRFREDLFYRLNVVPIQLPALRDRREDIPLLVDHFLAQFNEKLKKQVVGVDTDAMEHLVAYNWQGNIRELENVIERTMLFAAGPRIRLGDLPAEIQGTVPSVAASEITAAAAGWKGEEIRAGSLKEIVRKETERVERELIIRALEETGNNVSQAAKYLKISRKSLQLKMKEFGLRDREKGE